MGPLEQHRQTLAVGSPQLALNRTVAKLHASSFGMMHLHPWMGSQQSKSADCTFHGGALEGRVLHLCSCSCMEEEELKSDDETDDDQPPKEEPTDNDDMVPLSPEEEPMDNDDVEKISAKEVSLSPEEEPTDNDDTEKMLSAQLSPPSP